MKCIGNSVRQRPELLQSILSCLFQKPWNHKSKFSTFESFNFFPKVQIGISNILSILIKERIMHIEKFKPCLGELSKC